MRSSHRYVGYLRKTWHHRRIGYQRPDGLQTDTHKLEGEIIQFQEAKTYFKPTNKGNKLRDELQDKIDKAEEALEKKAGKISDIRRKLNELKSSAEDEE